MSKKNDDNELGWVILAVDALCVLSADIAHVEKALNRQSDLLAQAIVRAVQ